MSNEQQLSNKTQLSIESDKSNQLKTLESSEQTNQNNSIVAGEDQQQQQQQQFATTSFSVIGDTINNNTINSQQTPKDPKGTNTTNNSTPQSMSQHFFFPRFEHHSKHPKVLFQSTSNEQTVYSNLSMDSTTSQQGKAGGRPHIRINDYFALPTYFQQHFGAHRSSTNRSVRGGTQMMNFSLKGENSKTYQTSNATPAKSALVVGRISSGANNNNNLFSYGGGDSNKQISSESLVPIPNKGLYKGSKVFAKHVNIKHFTINREVLLELKQMKDLAHENLIRFVGICAEDQHISILTEYCEKGNLRDLLDNEGIRIDWPFRYSLINDIVEGMLFIHESSLNFHGCLKSTNCVIDSRLVVKLTDFGLKTLRTLSKQNSGSVQYSECRIEYI